MSRVTTNTGTQTIVYSDGSILKRKLDGTEVLSDHLEPGESLVSVAGRHDDTATEPQS